MKKLLSRLWPLALLFGFATVQSHSSEADVPPTPKDEAQQLVDFLLPMAERFLREQDGEFFPFGAQLEIGGKIKALAAYDGNEHPPSDVLIRLMQEALVSQAKAGSLQCSAIAYDAKVIPPGASEKTDAVVIELEHRSGYNVTVAFPYKLVDKKVILGSAYAVAGGHHIFPAAQ